MKFREAINFLSEISADVSMQYHSEMVDVAIDWIKKWPILKRDMILESQVWDKMEFGKVRMFAKFEGYEVKKPKGRCIQCYTNFRTQSYLGPSITALQNAYKKILSRRQFKGVGVTMACGMNHSDIGVWMTEAMARFKNPTFYERDGKSWDASMNEDHHVLKMRAYKCLGNSVKKAIDKGFKVKGFAKVKGGRPFKYSVVGTTKSGHNDTTLGNTIVNAGIALEALVMLGLEAEMIVAGDDLLVVIEGDYDAEKLAAVEGGLGIFPEYRKFNDETPHPFSVSFISGVFYPGPNGFQFGPKIGRLLGRLFWTCRPVRRRSVQEWRNGVVLGMQHIADVPIIRALLYSQYDPSKGVYRLPWKYAEPIKPEKRVISEQLVGFLCWKYGVSVSEIEEVEALLARLPRTGCVFKHPVLTHIIDVDMAELSLRPLPTGQF
jgi:hypothetical protein